MYITTNERVYIKNLKSSGIRVKRIQGMIGCARSTVYETLERASPRNGNEPRYITKKRVGCYKITAQIEARILDYITVHRFAIAKDIIRDLELNVKSTQTIGNVLKRNGIGTYCTAKKPFVNTQNKAKRFV